MKCIICGEECNYFFSKTYTKFPFNNFMAEIGVVDYWKCVACGFVLSKTHAELGELHWQKLNNDFHHFIENPENEKIGNQPPYAEQALMIAILGKSGVINSSSMLDYAAGYGSLSQILSEFFSIDLPIYDSHVVSNVQRYIQSCDLEKYDVVINSAMFEHVLKRSDLDAVHDLVSDSGCLIIHTVICEKIPNDPNWFYLVPPVHTAFHTNKSMQLLMNQWGYKSSIYCPKAKCWVFFKHEILNVESKLNVLNNLLQDQWFIYENKFVDYWKGY